MLIVSIVVFAVSRVMEKEAKERKDVVASQKTTTTTQAKTQVFNDIDKTISVELPTKYGLQQSHNSEYLIKLSSDNDMAVYISKMDKMEGRPLSSIARADRLAYIESYNANSNVSELKELSVNGALAYMYSFHYLDENLNKAFYLQVVLLESEDAIYIFDIDFPLDEISSYKNLLTDVLESFVKY